MQILVHGRQRKAVGLLTGRERQEEGVGGIEAGQAGNASFDGSPTDPRSFPFDALVAGDGIDEEGDLPTLDQVDDIALSLVKFLHRSGVDALLCQVAGRSVGREEVKALCSKATN